MNLSTLILESVSVLCLAMAATKPAGRQERRREETRRKLVAAATALFARQGVDNTRINEITEEADVGFGSFYNHFESKDAIVGAVLEQTVAQQGAAVAEMTDRDLDPVMGKAIAADGVGTVVASSVGGSPTTTYAENIGVMAATRVYSTAAYYVAALVAIGFGFSPKFGAVNQAKPRPPGTVVGTA